MTLVLVCPLCTYLGTYLPTTITIHNDYLGIFWSRLVRYLHIFSTWAFLAPFTQDPSHDDIGPRFSLHTVSKKG